MSVRRCFLCGKEEILHIFRSDSTISPASGGLLITHRVHTGGLHPATAPSGLRWVPEPERSALGPCHTLLLHLPSPLHGARLARLLGIIVLILVVEDNLSLPSDRACLGRRALAPLDPAQQALVIARDLADRLLHLFDAFRATQLHEHVAVLLVHALLDQQAPVIIRPVVVVFGFPALSQTRHPRLPLVRRDEAEKVQFHEAVELARGQLVLPTERFEQGNVEQVGGGNDALFVGHPRRRRGGVESDLRKGVVGAEAGVVTVIAQVVKGFVGILDRDFGNGRVGEECTRDGVEEMAAVGVVLMRR